MYAAASGRSMNPRGDYDPLMRGERPVGVRVWEKQRDRIIEELGVDIRTWQRSGRAWEAADVAHRCAYGRLFIMIEPNSRCWDCGVEIRPLNVASTRQKVAANTTPNGGIYVRKREPTTGTQRGKEGVEVLEVGVEVEEAQGSKAVQKSPRRDQKRFTSEEEAWETIQEVFGEDAADL
jgi:hypothetical protein